MLAGEMTGEPGERIHRDHNQSGADRHRHGQSTQQCKCGHDQEAASRADHSGHQSDSHTLEHYLERRQGSRDLADADVNGVGELLIRGQNIVAGYWNKPEQTAETFVDGWLHSGDLARVDEDGFVQIVDRKKDMVNRGGENVYCVEVENALVAHPAVFEVSVVGVPDEMMGEKVGAIVVLYPGMELTATELTAFAREHLADFKVPQYVTFRADPLPRNPGGKVLKPTLRKETEWGAQTR